jgi:N-acetyl-anhydromuramyl-L-alanine amidase AmpD
MDKTEALTYLEAVPFLEARHYRRGRRAPVRFVVVHDMEVPEEINSAEKWVQRTHTQDRVSSVNYGVDADSTWCAVRPSDEAFHVSGMNRHTVGIEHAGYARQTRGQWLDGYGAKMLERSADLTAALCVAFDVPVRRASVADLVNSERDTFPWVGGIVGHIDCTLAAKQLGRPNHGHWDPGPAFPWDEYLEMVLRAKNEGDGEMGYTLAQLELVATSGCIKALESKAGQAAIRSAVDNDAAKRASSTSTPKPAPKKASAPTAKK